MLIVICGGLYDSIDIITVSSGSINESVEVEMLIHLSDSSDSVTVGFRSMLTSKSSPITINR